MTTFDDREHAFEAKYAHDAEMQFKAEARRNKLAGLWAADLMGKTGDAAAWGPRLALGFEGLTASVIAGKGAMPPRGGGSDLTDTEVARAVAHLANLAGAGYTEPPVEQ